MTANCLRLIKRTNGGDPTALGVLYQQWGRAMHKVANSIIQDDGDSHDVVVDVLLKIAELPPERLPFSNAPAWMIRVTKNCAYDHLRKSERIILIDDIAQLTAGAELCPGYGRAELRLILGGLAEDERVILVSKAVLGFTHKEIAQSMQLPVASVRRKYATALKKASRLLTEAT